MLTYPVYQEFRRAKLQSGFCLFCEKVKQVINVTVKRNGTNNVITSCFECYQKGEEIK